ncbi:MAG TPA: hemerythrin domain-containing protein [Chitinophagaceae bacterium]
MKQEHRYNIFKRTHKGLRSMLFDAGAKIHQTDFTKGRQVKETLDAIRQSTRSFLYHLSKEDSIIYHSVVLHAPYIVAMIEQTNIKDEALARSIDDAIGQYKELSTKQEKIAFGHRVQAAFFEFTAAVLQHMNKEATVINELLWTHYTDRELVGIEVEMMKQATSSDCTWYTGKILKQLSNREILVWVDSIREHASPFMLKKLISTARIVLPIDRWQMIRGKFIMSKDNLNKAAA